MTENKFEVRNPLFREYILKKIEGQHFMKLVGFEITSIESGRIKGHMPIELKHKQQHGFIHGGVTATLLDIVMGFSAYSLVAEGQGVVTANLDIDYLQPGVGEELLAEGWVNKMGSKLAFCGASLYVMEKGEKKLIATGKSIMAVISGS